MANNENLKPIRTKNEAREKGKNGGKKSGEVRRAKKTMKDMLDYLLKKKIEDKKGKKVKTQEAITLALIKQALSGNVKAYEVIRDTIGEKPIENVNATNTNINIEDEKVVKEVLNKLKDL